MGFIPLDSAKAFPRVTPDEQAARDSVAQDLVGDEFGNDMPDESRSALEAEYQQRFNARPPTRGMQRIDSAAQRGFIPLSGGTGARGFIPAKQTPVAIDPTNVLHNVLANNPLTAAGEAALNLGTMGVALPAAGLEGLRKAADQAVDGLGETGASVVRAIGRGAAYLANPATAATLDAVSRASPADESPSDAVHRVAEALTYQPRAELGQGAAAITAAPFEKLAEVGQHAGSATLDATGSPGLATAVDTAINAIPMIPGAKVLNSAKATTARGLLNHHPNPSPQVIERLMRLSPEDAQAYFDAWQQGRNATSGTMGGSQNGSGPHQEGNVQRLEANDQPVHEPAASSIQELRRPGRDGLPGMDVEFPELPGGRGMEAGEQPVDLAGQDRYPGQLPAGERGMVDATEAEFPSEILPSDRSGWRGDDDYRGSQEAGDSAFHPGLETAEARQAPADRAPEGAVVDPQELQDDRALWGDNAPPGMGEEAGDSPGYHGPAPAGEEPKHVSSWPDPAVDQEIARADRILNDTGSIGGYVDFYNRHVADGKIIESYRQHPDGSYTLQVRENGKTAAASLPAEKVPALISLLRDPERVAELESRNERDMVLGRRVRELDDQTLLQWSGVGQLSEETRAKLIREARRRDREASRLSAAVDSAAHEAATSPLNSKPQPTQAQIDAGVYPKGHLSLHGLDIAIENPRGSMRSGIGRDGKPWETKLSDHYGYIKRTLAKDGDQVDVFIGRHPTSKRAFVVDQVDPATGRYDEPKVILGARDQAEARNLYHSNYEPGWRGMGAMTEMDLGGLKDWLKGDTKKPLGIQRVAGKAVTEHDAAALDRLSRMRALSDSARGKIAAEIERRAAYEQPSRAQVAEPAAAVPDLTPEGFDRSLSAEPTSATQDMAGAVQNASWNPGANYAPFVDESRAPAIQAKTTADLPAPVRREQIITELAKALGTTVYEGRVKGKSRLGFFRPHVEEVRIKRAADIETTAHELAHLIDSRVPELHQAWKADKDLAGELRSVSYDQKSVSEGFAEAVRLWMTQPETLEAKAPRAFAWLEDFATTHEYGPALRKAQESMTEWFGQDALNRARSKIGTDKPLAEFFDGFWDKFRQATVDDLHGVYRMERDLTGKINPAGPYESARLSRASASIADGAVRFGHPVKLPDGSFKFAGKGLDEILRPVAENLDDALLYFIGRFAAELMEQGREHLFTRGEINAMLRLRTPEGAKAFEEYQAWNKGVLDFAEAQGIINGAARKLWQRTQYLPFHRVEQPGGLKGKPGEWQGIQALTGGTTNIKDVLGNMLGNAAMLIDKAVKNEARRKIANLSQKEGGGRFMVKIEPGERMIKIGGDQVLEAMLKRYGIAVDGPAPAFFEFLIKGQPPAGKNVVAVLQDGKPVWFEVGDPILYRALQAIDRPVQSEVVRWLGRPKRIGQATITATPDFWMANIARDTLMGSVMSQAGFRPVIDSLQGMRLRLTNDPIYKDYLANGGGLSSIYLDEHNLRTKLERFYRNQGIDYRTVLDAPQKFLNFMETLGDAFEMSTRLGEYKRAIERGEHPRHAAYLGREVSTDFAAKGDSKALGFLMDVTMFLRPALVSWDRLYRGLAHDKNRGAIAAKAGTMAVMSAALYLLNKDDPRYADLQDFDRDSYWHFFIGDQHFRWPKIWEIGALSSAAERTVEKILAEDPEGLGKDFARILGATFNLNLMPQVLAPLYEQATNRNSFTKAPIEPPGMENVQPFLRAKPGTSETMKAAGLATRDLPESLQVNPARAEALLRGFFNTYATYVLMATDEALFGDQLPAKRADELPVVRRFYAEEPAKHTRYESEFYDLLQEAKRLRGTMRELDDQGLRAYADDKEKSPMSGEAKPLERAAKNLAAINREMSAIRRDGNLNPDQKREKLDALTLERNALLKDAVTESKAAQKENAK